MTIIFKLYDSYVTALKEAQKKGNLRLPFISIQIVIPLNLRLELH